MKTAAGAFILAIVLLLAGAVCFSEARMMRQVATQQQRLATLHYDDDAGVDSTSALINRLSLPFSSTGAVETQRAAVNYWQARYEVLAPLTGVTGDRQASDPNVLLIAANAVFRASHPDAGNPRAAVERLDSVMQAYGDVLRADPTNLDAAYNYEYVARLRDAFAKGRPFPRGLKGQEAVALSDDLPVGPTVHGRPGGPPPGVAMKDFKTFSPLQPDERGDLLEVSRKAAPRRRG